MRKLLYNYENPIDNIFIDASETVSPIFYNYNFTPNMITTLSNISMIIVIILLLNAKYYIAALFLLIAYFFDCLDGHYARKYNMVTDFGDYYDHVSDVIKSIMLLITLYYINKEKFMIVIPYIIIATILMMIHIGCQEKYYDSNNSPTLHYSKMLCPVNDVNNILLYTRFFGSGTVHLLMSLIIVYYDK